ncbi:putative HIT-like protein [BD1-7 clade bacterium]|uniref:Putative HIT-like protein n=1 Tax=BD1-7 clade bacterium TaxID=2029982 RepID=A0A5S9NLY6_9GAMM|nr:putative HIT-like protein [BD1-7 clade bacterium]CAA0094029.1 putative HIT-like protein [BD1-7 clade bacterium]
MASVFTQIMAGQIPGNFVWEDDECVAIMTIQPLRQGHLLVIPRQEIDHWDDLPDALASHVFLVAKKLAKALKIAFPCQRVGMMIAGLEVPHTHLHVVPLDTMADLDMSKLEFADPESLAAAAEKIRQAL